MGRDPIGYRGGISLYGYVENSPLSRRDPLGQRASAPAGQGVPIVCHCAAPFCPAWDVTVPSDRYGSATTTCDAACAPGTSTGWDITGAAPSDPGPPLCERVPWESLTGLDCVACCIEQNSLGAKVQILIGGTGIAVRPPVRKEIVLPGQSTTTNYWVRQCIRGGASKSVTLTVRIAGRFGVAILVAEGGYDCCLIGVCTHKCLSKS